MKTSKSAVFLFELMIIILVFVFAAAICTQVFVYSFITSKESHELTMSSIYAQTVAERFKADSPDAGSLYFDREWNATDEANAQYIIALEEQSGTSEMRAAYVNVYETNGDDAIYSLYVKRFAG